MHMIRKLGEDKKADWPSHLAEIVHAYNATRSAVTGYSPHYLMFGQQPRLPVDFVFPTVGSNEAPHERGLHQESGYLCSICERPIEEHPAGRCRPNRLQRHADKSGTMTEKVGIMNLKPGDLVLVKADAWKGKRKIKDRWDEETWEVSRQITADVPSYEVTNQHRQS